MSPDPGWVEVMRALWSPFVVEGDGGGPTINIERSGSEWALSVTEPSDLDLGTWPMRSEDPWQILMTLRYAIVDLARRRLGGYLAVHAAAVMRDGRALLLPGPNGTGKTTLTRELLERGWSYLTDDLAPISADSSEVRSFPKPLGIRQTADWESFLHRWSPPKWLGRPRGGFLVPASVFDYSTADGVPVDFVVFPRFREGGEERFVPLSAAEAIVLTGELAHGVDAGSLSVLSRLCSSAKCGTLEYGSSSSAISILERDVL